MRPRLFLHIGTMKTGSTAIQNYISYNSGRLLEQNIAYPAPMHRLEGVKGRVHIRAYQSYIAWELQRPGRKLRALQKELRKIKRRKGHAVLSAENLWMAPSYEHFKRGLPQSMDVEVEIKRKRAYLLKLKEFLEGFDVCIIVALRNQLDFIQSVYLQNFQQSGRLADFSAKAYADKDFTAFYRENLDVWEEVFGEENITVLPYDRERKNNTLVSSFFRWLDIDTQDFEDPPRTKIATNVGFSRDLVEYKRLCFPALAENPAFDRFLSDALWEYSALFEKGGEKYDVFSPEEKEELFNRFSAGNRELVNKYFDGEDIFDFPPLGSSRVYPGLSLEKVVAIGAFVHGKMVERGREPLAGALLKKMASWVKGSSGPAEPKHP